MVAIKNVRVGVPGIAPLLIASTLLWYRAGVLGIDELAGGRHISDFWSTMFVVCPFISAIFAILLVLSYRAGLKRYKVLFWILLVLGVSPLFFILGFIR